MTRQHPCQVTFDGIEYVLERYYSKLSEQDRIELNKAAVVLERLAQAQMDTAPHSCEVTASRLRDAMNRYHDRLDIDEMYALNDSREALSRLADEDRAAIKAEIES